MRRYFEIVLNDNVSEEQIDKLSGILSMLLGQDEMRGVVKEMYLTTQMLVNDQEEV